MKHGILHKYAKSKIKEKNVYYKEKKIIAITYCNSKYKVLQ